MTTKEAIDELILDIGYTINEVEEHEEFAECETGEYQIENYENNKRRLEAFTVILGNLDPSLSTIQGLKEKYEVVREEKFGGGELFEDKEPGEIEKSLYEILLPYGSGKELELSDKENKKLAKINIEEGQKRVVLDDDPDDVPDLSEDDTFVFYSYRGRVYVIYNDYADCDFDSYPESFQEKALEIIKNKLS